MTDGGKLLLGGAALLIVMQIKAAQTAKTKVAAAVAPTANAFDAIGNAISNAASSWNIIAGNLPGAGTPGVQLHGGISELTQNNGVNGDGTSSFSDNIFNNTPSGFMFPSATGS